MRTPLAAALAIVLAFGCTEAPTASTPQGDDAVAPDFNIANAPTFSGVVMRGEVPAASLVSDPKSGMLAVVGLDPADLCAGIFDFDLVPFQEVTWPISQARYARLLQGENMQTTVWPFTNFDCALFSTVTPLATGVSDYVYTNNDELWYGPPNAQSVTARAHGRLTLANGADAQFSSRFHIVSNGPQFGTLLRLSKVSLH